MSKDKGFAPIIILLIVLAIGGMGFTYFLGQQSNNAQPIVTPLTSTAPSTTPSVTTGLQVYTNTKYRYQFEYPKNWIVTDTDTNAKATATSEKIEIYDPEVNKGQFFTGMSISYHGMIMDTTNFEMSKRQGTTMYTQNTSHGEIHYINIPDTDQFLYISGADGYTAYENVNKTVKEIFTSFKFLPFTP